MRRYATYPRTDPHASGHAALVGPEMWMIVSGRELDSMPMPPQIGGPLNLAWWRSARWQRRSVGRPGPLESAIVHIRPPSRHRKWPLRLNGIWSLQSILGSTSCRGGSAKELLR